MIQIRHVLISDLREILDITNQEIIHGTAFWMITPRTLEEQTQWFHARKNAGFPIFVAVDEQQKIIGFASYGSFRPYEGYKYTVEHSVYVSRDAQGKGVGKSLLKSLVTHAENNNVHVMVACITGNNTASIRLHEWFGFKTSGILPETGVKFGKWLDLLFMYKVFSSHKKI